jgi:hypothetical protein
VQLTDLTTINYWASKSGCALSLLVSQVRQWSVHLHRLHDLDQRQHIFHPYCSRRVQEQERRLSYATKTLTTVTQEHHNEAIRVHDRHEALSAEARRLLLELTTLDPSAPTTTEPASALKLRYDSVEAELLVTKERGKAIVTDAAHNLKLQVRLQS